MLTSLHPLANPLMLPTGEHQIPVCVGDMPTHRYQAPLTTITEEIAHCLEIRPDVPGVVLMNGDKVHSVIPRGRLFERLGHMYGVELFLRKPIAALQKTLQTKIYTLDSDLRIQDAVRIALNRPHQDIYDPFVILYENGEIRLLDMYVLLIAQSHALQSVNHLMGSLARLERIIKADAPLPEILNLSLESLRKVVPFHRVAIHLIDPHFSQLTAAYDMIHPLDEPMNTNDVFQTVFNTRQPLHVDDVRMVPAWRNFPLLDGVRSWMGMPLLNSHQPLGMLSLMRHSNSPFNKDEMNMSKAFAELLANALHRETNSNSKPRMGGGRLPERKTSIYYN